MVQWYCGGVNSVSDLQARYFDAERILKDRPKKRALWRMKVAYALAGRGSVRAGVACLALIGHAPMLITYNQSHGRRHSGSGIHANKHLAGANKSSNLNKHATPHFNTRPSLQRRDNKLTARQHPLKMDLLLSKVTQHAMNYAIRSGITITTGYALKQCGRLVKEAPKGKEREELARLQVRLEGKIRIISPAIDMIELIAARGNTTLESAVGLTKDIRYEIQSLGVRLNEAANDEQLLRRNSSRAKTREQSEQQMRSIIHEIKALLDRIEDAVPLINLAITTSGVNLSTKLSGTISPSRLLQASTFLTAADSSYTKIPGRREQAGPTYVLSMYMLFAGHATRAEDEDGARAATWKEVLHKAKVKLIRLPLDQLYDLPGEDSGAAQASFRESTTSAEFAYQLLIVEDLDDDRMHTFEPEDTQPGPFDDVANAGIREVVPIHEISKVFYADTGKILNIGSDGETNNPVLLLKRDINADPPRRMLQRSRSEDRFHFTDGDSSDEEYSEIDIGFKCDSSPVTDATGAKDHPINSNRQDWRLPSGLDPEWMAFEVYSEEVDSDDDDFDTPDTHVSSGATHSSPEPQITSALSKLSLHPTFATPSPTHSSLQPHLSGPGLHLSPNKRTTPLVKTSLSLLEMLMKLAALQQFRQESHLAIEDELLNFFLEDSATAGAGADKTKRRRMRHDAVKQVGFDPYDESPIKRRNEAYIQRAGASPRLGEWKPKMTVTTTESVVSSPSPGGEDV
jgi:hypothetical protein